MLIAVLASGTGSILEALLADGIPVGVVVTDRSCRAETVAHRAGLPVELVARSEFGQGFDREGYTAAVVGALSRYPVGLIVMAGYGTVLGGAIHDAYPGRILNTHPSLLPAFKGWRAVEEALEARVDYTGCTVHVATLHVDEGPVLAQERVRILPADTPAVLHERIKGVERRLYPATIRLVMAELAAGRVAAGARR